MTAELSVSRASRSCGLKYCDIRFGRGDKLVTSFTLVWIKIDHLPALWA